MAEQGLYGVTQLGLSSFGLYQAQRLHEQELKHSRKKHEESIRLEREQHKQNLLTVKQTYLMELFHSLEQHFQQLNADLIANSRESERDMFDQRNQSFQTIILASSVMFTALSTVIVQGNLPSSVFNSLPDANSEIAFIAYAVTCSLSFAFLFLCIVICIEIVTRASMFMYDRANVYRDKMQIAIESTRNMMKKLRDKDADIRVKTTEKLSQSGLNINSEATAFRRVIAKMNAQEVDDEWKRHEKEIHLYLEERERINEDIAGAAPKTSIMINGEKVKSFQDFWRISCKFWASIAVMCFYVGTLNLLLAIIIFMYFQFSLTYKSISAAIIAVALIGFGLVVGTVAVLVFRRNRVVQAENDLASHSSSKSNASSLFQLRRDISYGSHLSDSSQLIPERSATEISHFDETQHRRQTYAEHPSEYAVNTLNTSSEKLDALENASAMKQQDEIKENDNSITLVDLQDLRTTIANTDDFRIKTPTPQKLLQFKNFPTDGYNNTVTSTSNYLFPLSCDQQASTALNDRLEGSVTSNRKIMNSSVVSDHFMPLDDSTTNRFINPDKMNNSNNNITRARFSSSKYNDDVTLIPEHGNARTDYTSMMTPPPHNRDPTSASGGSNSGNFNSNYVVSNSIFSANSTLLNSSKNDNNSKNNKNDSIQNKTNLSIEIPPDAEQNNQFTMDI